MSFSSHITASPRSLPSTIFFRAGPKYPQGQLEPLNQALDRKVTDHSQRTPDSSKQSSAGQDPMAPIRDSGSSGQGPATGLLSFLLYCPISQRFQDDFLSMVNPGSSVYVISLVASSSSSSYSGLLFTSRKSEGDLVVNDWLSLSRRLVQTLFVTRDCHWCRACLQLTIPYVSMLRCKQCVHWNTTISLDHEMSC